MLMALMILIKRRSLSGGYVSEGYVEYHEEKRKDVIDPLVDHDRSTRGICRIYDYYELLFQVIDLVDEHLFYFIS